MAKMNKKNNLKIKINKISYNAFKMWGSYLGAVIYASLTLFNYNLFYYPIKPLMFLLDLFIRNLSFCKAQLASCMGLGIILAIILTLIVGFLLGWGVHSLVRYLKNRGKQ
jgi:hypothetical protein